MEISAFRRGCGIFGQSAEETDHLEFGQSLYVAGGDDRANALKITLAVVSHQCGGGVQPLRQDPRAAGVPDGVQIER